MAIRRIGQILVDLGFITDDQLEMLLDEQRRRPGELLGKLAESMGLITDEQLAQALAEQMAMKVVTLGDLQHLRRTSSSSSPSRWRSSIKIMPIEFKDDTLTIAMCEPQKLTIQDELRTLLGYNIKAMVATERDVQKALRALLRRRLGERRKHRGRPGSRRGAGRGRRGRRAATGRST